MGPLGPPAPLTCHLNEHFQFCKGRIALLNDLLTCLRLLKNFHLNKPESLPLNLLVIVDVSTTGLVYNKRGVEKTLTQYTLQSVEPSDSHKCNALSAKRLYRLLNGTDSKGVPIKCLTK